MTILPFTSSRFDSSSTEASPDLRDGILEVLGDLPPQLQPFAPRGCAKQQHPGPCRL